MAKQLVLVLGAGFSKAAGGPLLGELFHQQCRSRSRAHPRLFDALFERRREFRPDGSEKNNEDFFTDVWRAAAIGAPIRIGIYDHDAQRLQRDLTIHLASVCGGIKLRRKGLLWETHRRFFETLALLDCGVTIISFNYDLLVEQLLDDARIAFAYRPAQSISYDDKNRRRRVARAEAPLSILKLHGSANWGVCPSCPGSDVAAAVVAYEKPYLPLRRRPCPHCGRLMASGIVPPMVTKAGSLRDYEPAWREARRALERASKVVVMGYSMPTGDAEARNLMKYACGDSEAHDSIVLVNGPRGDMRPFFGLYENAVGDTALTAIELMEKVNAGLDLLKLKGSPERNIWQKFPNAPDWLADIDPR